MALEQRRLAAPADASQHSEAVGLPHLHQPLHQNALPVQPRVATSMVRTKADEGDIPKK
jgi:hypothetical protein